MFGDWRSDQFEGSDMRELLLAVTFSLSLLLCAAMAVPWVRSYWIADGLTSQGFIRTLYWFD